MLEMIWYFVHPNSIFRQLKTRHSKIQQTHFLFWSQTMPRSYGSRDPSGNAAQPRTWVQKWRPSGLKHHSVTSFQALWVPSFFCFSTVLYPVHGFPLPESQT